MNTLNKWSINRHFLLHAVLVLVLGTLINACAVTDVKTDQTTTYYFVRHGEIVKGNPDKPLSEQGKQRAQALQLRLQHTRLTHILATHTDRTRDTATPVASGHGLSIQQVPIPGTNVNGEVITNRSKGKFAIGPMTNALHALPPGSAALIAANSGNLYALMAGLGVRVDASCKADSDNCIPCNSKKCFPKKQFNNLWTVVRDSSGGVSMTHSTYGE